VKRRAVDKNYKAMIDALYETREHKIEG